MKRLIFILPLFFLSCSQVDVAYDWGPRLAANYLDDQFDFTSERYNQVKNSLTNDFKNNRPVVKKIVVQHLETVLQSVDKKDLSDADIREFVKQLRASQKELVYAFSSTFKEVVNKMSKEEMANMKTSINERWEKQNERLEKLEQYRKKSTERFEDNMETYFDKVTDEQKKIFSEFVEKNFEYQKYQLEQRKSVLSRFEEKFEQKPELLDLTLKIYSNDDSVKTAEQKARDEEAINNTVKLVLKIRSSLNPEQISYFKKTLNELKTDIEKL